MTCRDRGGVMTAIAMAIVLLLALMATAVHLMTRQSHSELMRIDGFLRAVAVGEACYTRTVGRLESRPWAERWFKGGSDSDAGLWKDGSYEYLIADGPGEYECDLLVRAMEETRSKVMMFWRLRADPYTLSQFRQVKTYYFTHTDPATPLNLPGLDALRQGVGRDIDERDANREWADEREKEIGLLAAPDPIAGVLGSPPGPPIPDVIAAAAPGAPPVPIGPRAGPAVEPPPPALPPFPPADPGPLPTGPPPAVQLQGLAAERQQIALDRAALEKAIGDLNNLLGFDRWNGAGPPPADQSSDYIRIEWRIKQKLRECNALDGDGGAFTCPPEEVQRIKDCERAIDLMNSNLRPETQAATNEMFVTLGMYDQLSKDIDASAAPPGPSQSQIAEFRSRAASIRQRANEWMERGRQIRERFNAAIAAAGCNAL